MNQQHECMRWTSLGLVTIAALLASAAQAQTTTRVSVSSAGVQGNQASPESSISADGRRVAFESESANLVTGDTNGVSDIFIRDRLTALTTRASVSSAGVQSNGSADAPLISADSRVVVFSSQATNLILGVQTNTYDAFARDLVTGQTELVSVTLAGTDANDTSFATGISGDGRYVAFQSLSTDLVPGDTNGLVDAFVRDRVAGVTTRVSISSSGSQGNGLSLRPVISADGRLVAFWSEASNLVLGDTNGVSDIFVFDRGTGVTTRVSVSSSGAQANNFCSDPSISATGRFVAFASRASNLGGVDANNLLDVFVHDRRAGTTACASVDPAGVTGNGFSHVPGLSADGRHLAFQSLGSNLVPLDTNGNFDVFVRDLVAGQTTRWSVDTSGAQSNGSTSGVPALSADGRVLTFCSDATNLVTSDTNNRFDAFVRALAAANSGIAICAGDGSGTACPCANPGAAGHGCGSVQVAAGASLAASGTPSVSADSFWLSSSDLPANAAVTFVQGTGTLNGVQGVVFANGLRCVGGLVVRLGTETHTGGTTDFGVPVGNERISVRGGISSLGGTVHYQAIYRDGNQSSCAPATYNATNAWSTVWLP